MNTSKPKAARRAFTMVELMIVIAVIGLLVAILMPAIATVQTKARAAQTQAQFNGLRVGIEAYRGEQVLGGRFPPSSSDNPENHQFIANPLSEEAVSDMPVAGAHLLVHALLGADLLGTPGFVDTDSDTDGLWYNNTHRGEGGGYELDVDTAEPVMARYGGAGFVDDNMKGRIRTLNELEDDGVIAVWPDGDGDTTVREQTGLQPLFVDSWDHPILYYRANRAAIYMLGDPKAEEDPGIYQQEDNGLITGSDTEADSGAYKTNGIDFGSGGETGETGTWFHDLAVAVKPPNTPDVTAGINDIESNDSVYEASFARFIYDPSVKMRNTSVRKDSYLLVSAGPDGRYGTADDITNWTRGGD